MGVSRGGVHRSVGCIRWQTLCKAFRGVGCIDRKGNNLNNCMVWMQVSGRLLCEEEVRDLLRLLTLGRRTFRWYDFRPGLFFDHPRPVKVQGAVTFFSFLRVFREILARLSQERKADLILQRYAARADVAPRRAELLLYSQRIASRNRSKFRLKRTKTSCSTSSSHLSSYAPGWLEDDTRIRSAPPAHSASPAWWTCTWHVGLSPSLANTGTRPSQMPKSACGFAWCSYSREIWRDRSARFMYMAMRVIFLLAR